MQVTSTKKPKNNLGQFVDQNPVEAIRNIGSGAIQSFANDVLKEGASDFWEQMVGTHKKEEKEQSGGSRTGELQEGQDLDLHDVAPGIDYRREILHGSKSLSEKESHVLKQQIEMIVIELKRLASSSKELEIQFKDVVIEQRIEKPGKYHQGFFEWMLIIVKTARMKIEDASIWFQALKGKKNKKKAQNYWQMFKKHGTTFGLSNERVVSTQTG